MAEAIARDRLQRQGVPARVSSAGTLGIQGHGASPNSARALAEIGLDLTSHRSRGATTSYLLQATAIVVMSENHARWIERLVPETVSKIHRLWEYTTEAGRLAEIADPVGCRFEAFLACREDLLECVENWLGRFVKDHLPA
jgi:protein-tyrosine phosphatase